MSNTEVDEVRIEQLARVNLRPLATPLPLGLLGLALGSLMLSALQLGWISQTNTPQVGLVLLVFVTPVQVITALLSFYIRDVVMATALGLLAGSWASSGVLLLQSKPGGTSQTLGLLAIGVAVALLVPAIGVSFAKPVASVLVVVAACRFAATGIFELTDVDRWQTVGGVIGVVLMCTATYAALAFALEDARHHPVLPVSRRDTSSAAMSGSLAGQLEHLATEAGVRQES
jgi:hypothetical protein